MSVRYQYVGQQKASYTDTIGMAQKFEPRHVQTVHFSEYDAKICQRYLEFVIIVIAWRFARWFKCGKLGKLTYSQLLAEYF